MIAYMLSDPTSTPKMFPPEPLGKDTFHKVLPLTFTTYMGAMEFHPI